MLKNEGTRVWVNRIFAFVAGGLIVLAIMSVAAVTPVKNQNAVLTTQLDELQNGAARLLAESRLFVADSKYQNAQNTLKTLFEKHSTSTEAAEGKKLLAEIETAIREQDRAWDAVAENVRTAWEKTKAQELRSLADVIRKAVDSSMAETLSSEWEKEKDRIREKWQNGEV